VLLLLSGIAAGVAILASLASLGLVGDSAWPGVAIGASAVAGIAFVGSRRARRPMPPLEAEASAGWRDFRRELSRSRRHGYHMALVRLPGDATDPVAVGDRLARVRRGIRRIDAAWPTDDDVYLLLPQTDRAGVAGAISRVSGAADRFVSVAVFPEDGLTSGALIAAVGGSAPGPAPMVRQTEVEEPRPAAVERA